MIALYFAFGAGFYLGLAANYSGTFLAGESKLHMVMGLIGGLLLGFLFWPLGIGYTLYTRIWENK